MLCTFKDTEFFLAPHPCDGKTARESSGRVRSHGFGTPRDYLRRTDRDVSRPGIGHAILGQCYWTKAGK